MKLVLISAVLAVCGAARLDRTYLPPSAPSSGGSPGLQAPLTRTSEQGLETPKTRTGSYTNDFEGVVVDAAPGTRSSETLSGLGGPRPSYGSSNSKVGDAAFRGSAGFRGTQFGSAHSSLPSGQFSNNGNNFESSQFDTHSSQGFAGQTSQVGQFQGFQNFDNKPERPQAAKDRNSNILSQSNEVDADRYSYGFETDNGIAVGVNGVDVNGIQAEGGYSYQGDDGQVYKVTYVADERGYRPQGAHLPTPPPIPEEILKSLEKNAKDEASGLVDDGSYDAQKYNTDSDYTHDNNDNIQHNGGQLSHFGKQPESASTFNNHNTQAFGTSGSSNFGLTSQSGFNGQLGQENVNAGHVSNTFVSNQDRFGNSESQANYGQGSQANSQSGSTQFSSGSQVQSNIGQSSQANQFNSNSGSAHTFGQSSSGQHGSSVSGQSFGQTGSQSLSHSQGAFGSQSNFGSQGQQASASALFENKTPESDSTQSQQGFNQFSSSSRPSGSNIAHSQSLPESGTSFKPQGSEAFSGASLNQNQDAQDFGKPFPQVFSGENFNRPSAGNFNRKPIFGSQVNKGSSFNRFPQPSGQFSTQKEYLPPSKDQPQSNKYEPSVLTPNSGASNLEVQKEQNSFLTQNRPSSNFGSASASTFSQSTFQPQPARPLNAFETQPDNLNQFNQQTNQFTLQTSQPSPTQAQFSTSPEQSGSFTPESVSDFSTNPTTIPDTELTTPLEPNEKPASQSSQFLSQSSNLGSFTFKPTNQGQTQFGFQGNSEQTTGQTLSPSVPTPSSQFGAALPQSAFQSSFGKEPKNPNISPQFPQTFGQPQQNQPSGQNVDNSYYYNQPSKPFGALAQRPQESRFPSAPSYQSNGIANQNQFFNKQSFQSSVQPSSLSPVGATSATQSTQSQGYKGITQAAASSFPSAFPTQSAQIGMSQISQFESRPSLNPQPNTGSQVQSIGALPSFSQQTTTEDRTQGFQFGSIGSQSTGSQSSYNQQSGLANQAQVTEQERFPTISSSEQRPASTGSQTNPQSGLPQPSESSGSSSQSVQTQQYQGAIYEYNKPAEVLPATQTDNSSGQISTNSETKPSFGQSQNSHINKQPLGIDIKFDAQNDKPFNRPSFSQLEQQTQITLASQSPEGPGTQFASQPAKPFTQLGQNSQLTFDSSNAQNNQEKLPAQSFKPFGSAGQVNQAPFSSKPQFGSQSNRFSQNSQSFVNLQPSPTEEVSQPQLNSQNIQNIASNSGNGYFYPENPKPLFGEEAKNQFSQNPQPNRPQTGFSNQYSSIQQGNPRPTNQVAQFSASRPQFGIQNNKHTQAAFGQRIPNSPYQANQPQFGQSSASSQAFATGQATASASAYTSDFEAYSSQDKTQSQIQEDKNEGTEVGQGTNGGAHESKAKGTNAYGSKPFKSACCQGIKDSASAQSTDRPSSFTGVQGFNAQGLAGKGEQFGGPRQSPSFDEQTGYHY